MPYLGNVPSSFNVGTDNINNDAITTAKIADGAILNADVNAAAAIAGTKINPDFGSQNILTTGTATAASLIPTSSTVPTNGLYLPAANSVALSTGGSGRLFVNSDGNVSLGATTNDAVGSTSTLTIDRAAGNGQLSVAANGTVRGRIFADNSTSELRIGNPTANALMLFTNNTERLRITAAGLVGVGTSSPSARLDVRREDADGLIAEFHQSTGYGVDIRSSESVAAISSGYLQALTFRTDAGSGQTERFRITSGGNVGIGTTSPVFGVGDGVEVARSGVATVRVSSNTQGVELRSDNGTGTLETRAAYPLLFGTSGTERARIDSSGRLLVGTSSARSNFFNLTTIAPSIQLEGSTTATSSLSVVQNAADSAPPSLILAKSRSTGYAVLSSGDTLGRIPFMGADGSEFVEGAVIVAEVDGTPGANDMPGRLVFSVTQDGSASPTEAMRITNAREVCIGTTAAHVANRNALENATTGQLTFRHSGASAGRYNIVGMTVGSAFVVADATGLTGVQLAYSGTSWSTLSDERHKTDLMPIDDGLAKVGSLRAVIGRLVTDPESKSRSFLIAQDVQAVLPQAVDTTDPDALALSYTEVIPLLVAALKESKERIETLEAKVAALESA